MLPVGEQRSVKSVAAQAKDSSQAQGDCGGRPRIPDRPDRSKGAFTSEIDLSPIIKPGPLNTVAEADRPHLVDQPGMRHKYLPLRHDPATGALSSGGRYLFRHYEDATKYRDFLEAKVFPSEQKTFFFNTVRLAWWRDWRVRSRSDHHT